MAGRDWAAPCLPFSACQKKGAWSLLPRFLMFAYNCHPCNRKISESSPLFFHLNLHKLCSETVEKCLWEWKQDTVLAISKPFRVSCIFSGTGPMPKHGCNLGEILMSNFLHIHPYVLNILIFYNLPLLRGVILRPGGS